VRDGRNEKRIVPMGGHPIVDSEPLPCMKTPMTEADAKAVSTRKRKAYTCPHCGAWHTATARSKRSRAAGGGKRGFW
jgi:hypothetical protein